ncbi:MAG TPA: DUF2846 domain-containing protein [Pyrinomonadaceae bacterium]|jgi:hypothetical protein|nr:DUF2846 domain-containing protein [Pyrinomonadaceae bacterium]
MKYLMRSVVCALLIAYGHAAVRAQDQQPPAAPSPSPQAEQQPPPAATTEPSGASQAEEKTVTVYIYRPKKFVGSALEPSVFCDGVELGRMDNGRYIMLRLAPGTHRFHMTEKDKRVEETLKPGQVIYLRFRLEPGMWKGHGNLYLADEEEALKELKKLKPLAADKLKDKTMVVTDMAEAEAETKKRVSEQTPTKKS